MSNQLAVVLISYDFLLYCTLGLQGAMDFSNSFGVSQLTKQETAVAVFLHDFRSRESRKFAESIAGVDYGIIKDLSICQDKYRICEEKVKIIERQFSSKGQFHLAKAIRHIRCAYRITKISKEKVSQSPHETIYLKEAPRAPVMASEFLLMPLFASFASYSTSLSSEETMLIKKT